ncbi:branched-chain amino acid aminotransferase [Bacillus sp. MMSF_3328]|uniref:branched-chain amino acid aminotransferase n=1 Tax=Bacillus sp. MMSF_3328 TaxID=3047080 RepID=UPI00273F395E|nr:branched-chain amino acid aminotransferase [Bacillus sp. MMSF_3328]
MLKENLASYIEKEQKEKGTALIFEKEKEYLGMTDSDSADGFTIGNEGDRFREAYLERGDKETEEILAEESPDFLEKPISYFREHKREFVYMESKWFDVIGADAVSLEVDDVFGNYDIMLGLKLQKKYQKYLKDSLDKGLEGSGDAYELMFDSGEGIWNLNFSLDALPGFHGGLSVGEAYSLVYGFLFNLAEGAQSQQG